MLAKDDFSNVLAGELPVISPELTRYTFTHENGEYVIRRTDNTFQQIPTAYVRPGTFGDITISIDARITSAPTGRFITLGCRSSDAGRYRLVLEPAAQAFLLSRYDRATDKEINLTNGWQKADVIRAGDALNRMELTCAGDRFTVQINGTKLFETTDTTYKMGTVFIGAGQFTSQTPGPVEARFDNLLITQR